MFRNPYVVIALSVITLSSTLPALAAPGHATAQQRCYELLQVRIADAKPGAFFWEVRQVAGPEDSDTDAPMEVFSSLASPDLRRWVSHLPAHSQIRYTVGLEGVAMHGVNKVNTVMGTAESRMDNFRKFCQSKGVTFSVIGVAA